MASTSRTAEVLLKYTIDNASANRVRASFTSLEAELSDLRSELTGVGTSAQAGVNGLRQRFAAGEASVESMQDEVEQLRAELLRLDDVNVTPTVTVQQTGGGATGGGLNGILEQADRSGRTINQVLGGLGMGAAGGIADTIGDIAGAFTSLNPVMLAVTAAGVGIAAVFGDIQKRMEEARQAATEYLARQTEINLLLLQGDTAALEAKRDQLTQQIQAREDAASSVRALIQRFDELQVGADAILSGQEDLNTTGLTYTEILNEQERVIQSIRDMTGNQSVTIGIAEASMEEFNAETARMNVELTLTKNTLDEVAASAATVGDKAVEFINKTMLALDNAIKASKDKGIGSGIQGAIGQGMTAFQDSQSARLSALQTLRTDAYLGAMTKTIQSQEALTAAQNAYNEAVAASQQRISDINAKLDQTLAEAETERLASLQEAEQRAGEDQVKAKEAYESRKAQIERQFNRSHFNALANRDALADKMAKDQFEDETDANKKNRSDQLKTINDGLKRQNAAIEASYKKTVATAQSAAQAAIRTEQLAAQARLNVLQQGVQAAQVALVNAQQAEYLTKANFYNTSVSQAASWANLMQLYMAYGFSIPNTTSPYNPKQPGIIGKWAGGDVQAGVPYVVGEKGPELFVPQTPGHIVPNGGASMITINLTGAQMGTIKATSRQQVLTTLNRMFDQMGVA